MVIVTTEQITEHRSAQEKLYYSFWVRVNFSGMYFSIAGWKYFPDKDTVSGPSQAKGPGKGFFNTAKMDPGFYNLVLDRIRHTLGVVPTDETNTTAA